MAKSTKSAKPVGKSAGKARASSAHARPTASKARPTTRMSAESNQGNWATELVFDVREPKLAVSLRLDADVLRFFRGFGAGYQTRINEVLKAFMHARSEPENGAAHTIPHARMARPSGSHAAKRAR